jgi:hypothetical protein
MGPKSPVGVVNCDSVTRGDLTEQARRSKAIGGPDLESKDSVWSQHSGELDHSLLRTWEVRRRRHADDRVENVSCERQSLNVALDHGQIWHRGPSRRRQTCR